MPYWVFENQTVKHKAVIHRGDCPDCKRKAAGDPNLPGEEAGRWHGPFDTVNAAVQAAITTDVRSRNMTARADHQLSLGPRSGDRAAK